MKELIVTIGPSSDTPQVLKELKSAGATKFRINLSHASENTVNEYISNFKSGKVPISLDTQGAQLRTSGLETPLKVEKGEIYTVGFADPFKQNEIPLDADFCLNHSEAFSQFSIGDRLRIDFEGVQVEIREINENSFKVIGESSGYVRPNKSVDIEGKSIKLPALTYHDKEMIKLTSTENIEAIFLSFCDSAEDVEELRKEISEERRKKTRIYAKIETTMGLLNIVDILKESDGVLIDRGDLSREVSISKIPHACNVVIEAAKKEGKPCFVATNVLDSMLKSSLPSRAEISDLHGLLSKGVSGIVLAAEVAIGENPVDCVHVVKHMYRVYDSEKIGISGLIPSHQLIDDLPETLSGWL